MKNLIVIILGCVLSFSSFAQSKELRKAMKDGKNRNSIFEAEFKKPAKENNIASWCRENNLVLISTDEGQFARFGGYEKGIVGASFMTVRDYNAGIEAQRLANQRRVEYENQQFAKNMALLGVAVKGTVEVGKKVVGLISSNSTPSDNSSSSYSNNGSMEYEIVERGDWKSLGMTDFSDKRKRLIWYNLQGDSFRHTIEIHRLDNGKYTSGTGYSSDKDGLFSAQEYNSESECIKDVIEQHIRLNN